MLLWMGYGMIKDSSSAALDTHVDESSQIKQKWHNNPIIAGMVISLSNPYWLIWWATIGLTLFAALSHNVLQVIAAFYLGHISGDIIWYLAVGGAVATGRKFIDQRVYGMIIKICGVILILLAALFIYLTVSGRLWTIKMDMTSLQQKIESVNPVK